MLKDDFFTITTLATENDTISASLELNEKHKIFDGHFPGKPVVPGVCMLQMVKEATEAALGNKLLLTRAEELKFLMIIDPAECRKLEMLLKYIREKNGKIIIEASLLKDRSVCFKFKGQFSLSD